MNKPTKAQLRATSPSEHQEAVAFMQWTAIAARRDPRIGLIFAIPNGGKRNVIVARKMKAEGVKPGVPDYFFTGC